MGPDIITQASDEINKRLKEVSGAQPECTIYRVHRHLRDLNPKAYEPEVIAIGPYHNNSEHLKRMEGHKLRYLKQLLDANDPLNDVKRYVAVVSRVEAEARRCYADLPETLTPAEFIQMLVLDGCFIVQLVRKFETVILRDKNDPIFQMNWMINSLQRDLMLFENQLPFFVLCELYDLIEAPGQHSMFWNLLFNFFTSLYPGQGSEPMPIVDPRQVITLGTRLRLIGNATRLQDADVEFKNQSRGETLFDVRYKKGVMTMAPLTIEDRTESFLQNLIAYEQYFEHNQNTFVTDYVKFLDCIVDSSMDVEILSRKGIIHNSLGDEDKVAEMVNKLGVSVAEPGNGFVYAKMFEDVHKHCAEPWNMFRAILRRDYFNTPLALLTLFIGLLGVYLAVMQTAFSVLEYYRGKK
ncbi:UPF0481 protein At3g47200-like isoform X2 [Salvia hispanica]|uniref:UPF0481 protein At3g47200-like isoform X2 n=1 Tax=Salvia hispanica TaxID=49212 RepID=UPI0020094A08|nr:UPF0481 protein At3g47200-like isoform X2 [Salvia hispanica]